MYNQFTMPRLYYNGIYYILTLIQCLTILVYSDAYPLCVSSLTDCAAISNHSVWNSAHPLAVLTINQV